MKILHFYYRFQMGGSENLTLAIIKNDKVNKHIILVLQKRSEFQKYCEQKYNVNFINAYIKTNSLLSIDKWKKIFTIIRNLKPDVINSYMYDGSLYARIVGIFFKIPIVVYIVNVYTKKRIKRGLINYFLSYFTKKIIVCSDDVKNDVLKYDRVKKDKIITIPSFAIFNFKCDFSKGIRKSFHFKKTDFMLLTIARLVPQKGISYLVNAINICVNDLGFKEMKLVIVGDGPLMKLLKDLVRRKNLTKNIFFVGEQFDINPFLSEADLYVDSSVWAGMNVASIKALEAKLPIIITDVGGAKQLTLNGKYGVLCKPKSSISLVNSITACYSNRKNLNLNGYKYIKNNFSDSAVASKIIDIYKSVVI